MRVAGERPDGLRLRALIVLLWRAGLRIGEALALAETDLDRSRGAVLVRRGKRPRLASNTSTPLRPLASEGDLPRTSSAMPTRSRWRTRGTRSS